MHKQLFRPKELAIAPSAPDADKAFKYWLRTVEDFIESLEESRAENDPAVNKKRIIVSCLSPETYLYIEDADSYDDIVTILRQIFVKRKNNVYARHLLVSRRQAAGDSISEYLQVLKNLAKDCTFAAVTANQYREKLIRDAFVNRLSSPSIRQRLLESDGLDITRAYELADSLDRTHRQSSSMEQPHASLLDATAPQYSKEKNITDTFVCDTPDMASEAES